MGISFDAVSLQIMKHFEYVTRARLKTFFELGNSEIGETMVFVVLPGNYRKAVGPEGKNAKKLKEKYKKTIKIVEFSDSREKFITNMIRPLRVDSYAENGDVIILSVEDTKTKGLLIGRNARNLRQLEEAVKHFFPLQEIKVQ